MAREGHQIQVLRIAPVIWAQIHARSRCCLRFTRAFKLELDMDGIHLSWQGFRNVGGLDITKNGGCWMGGVSVEAEAKIESMHSR
jgi:hypothetical protein